jgi:glucokinase
MYIGIDIGGTKTAIGIGQMIGGHVEIRSSSRILTDAPAGPLAFIERAVQTIDRLIVEQHLVREELQGIGIGCTGPIDVKKGIIMNPYTLPGWESFELADRFRQRFKVPVRMENDVNVILLGEVALSQLYHKNVSLIMFGTGIGIACYQSGSLHTTRSSYHPEMGHTIVSETGPACYCGNHGCMESLVSGKAINASAREAGFDDFEGLYQHYLEGDERAVALMERKLHQMASGIWNILLIFHSDIVILGGGLMQKFYDFFSEQLTRHIPGSVDFTGKFVFSSTHPDDTSSLVGAITLIQESLTS